MSRAEPRQTSQNVDEHGVDAQGSGIMPQNYFDFEFFRPV